MSEPTVIESISHMQALAAGWRREGATVGFVPTMGALHEGHLALIDEARKRADFVVVSIFVNPTQFGDASDLKHYPRDLDGDVKQCASAGVDVVFHPSAQRFYPDAPARLTSVKAGPLAKKLEGRSRPGHFDGVVTVCTALFHIVAPHFAVFGEKDFQQLTLLRRLVRDLHLPLEIVPMPVLRDPSGLALSSRNARLSPRNKKRALCLSQAIAAAQSLAEEGEARTSRLRRRAREVLAKTPEFEIDYVAVVDPATLEAPTTLDGAGRILIAGSIGKRPRVRLIDNGPIFVGALGPTPLF